MSREEVGTVEVGDLVTFTDFGLHRHRVEVVRLNADGSAHLLLTWWRGDRQHRVMYASVPHGKGAGRWVA